MRCVVCAFAHPNTAHRTNLEVQQEDFAMQNGSFRCKMGLLRVQMAFFGRQNCLFRYKMALSGAKMAFLGAKMPLLGPKMALLGVGPKLALLGQDGTCRWQCGTFRGQNGQIRPQNAPKQAKMGKNGQNRSKTYFSGEAVTPRSHTALHTFYRHARTFPGYSSSLSESSRRPSGRRGDPGAQRS